MRRGHAPAIEQAPLRHTPPEEIVIRTDRFRFHTGARIDETWPARAEETRVALGAAMELLLEEEDTTVPILARQLGVDWPSDPVDFDVLPRGPRSPPDPCAGGLRRRLSVGDTSPVLFFACTLDASLAWLKGESALYRGMGTAGAGDAGGGGPATRDGLYACIVRYAVAAVLVARTPDRREAKRAEVALGEACAPKVIDWLGREWVKRVREEESAEAFGARAGREIGER